MKVIDPNKIGSVDFEILFAGLAKHLGTSGGQSAMSLSTKRLLTSSTIIKFVVGCGGQCRSILRKWGTKTIPVDFASDLWSEIIV